MPWRSAWAMNERFQKIQRLSQALFISGVVNIILICLLFYLIARDKPPAYFESKPTVQEEIPIVSAIGKSNAQVIRELRKMPFEQLLTKLGDTQVVEDGYAQRDLALAVLVDVHHIDLLRALGKTNIPEQPRTVIFGKHKNGKDALLRVYPAFTDSHFDAILQFIRTEKWPFTAQGLHQLLRESFEQGRQLDPSLVEAFFLTPEFLAFDTLFTRSQSPLKRKILLKMICEGDWQLAFSFAEQQRLSQDLSPARRQKLLLDYMDQNSKFAAYIILKTDREFARHKLDDEHVLTMLRLLTKRTADAERFAKELLTSPRSDKVWKMAARSLYIYAGETPPEKFEHHAALTRFVHAPTALVPNQIQKSVKSINDIPKEKSLNPYLKLMQPKKRVYIVQEKDSLWKISRKFNIDVEKIRKTNALKTDVLKPGTLLDIPSPQSQ